eukprot:15482898-Alexandrium_andersonii.AAC.1
MAGSSAPSSMIWSPTTSQLMARRMMGSHFSGRGMSGSAIAAPRFRPPASGDSELWGPPCGPPASGDSEGGATCHGSYSSAPDSDGVALRGPCVEAAVLGGPGVVDRADAA